MKMEDVSGMRQPVVQDRIAIPEAVERCREPQYNVPSDKAGLDEYLPMPTPQPIWPRVFPGL